MILPITFFYIFGERGIYTLIFFHYIYIFNPNLPRVQIKLIEVTEDTEIFSKSLQWNIMHIYFVEFFFLL